MTPPHLWRCALAELVATAFLVFTGCGAIVVEQQSGALGHAGVAAAFGLIIMVMILTTGHLSGAHLNPAVTLAFLAGRRLAIGTAAAYVGAQLVGAVAGALLLRWLVAGPGSSLGATLPRDAAASAFGLEVLLTMMLMLVIVAVATDRRAQGSWAALAIGGTVGLQALWAGPLTGASMNPARSFGPALVAGVWNDHAVYWLGPILGALAGAGLYALLRGGDRF